MAKFKVTVKVIAECEYEMEVEAERECDACDAASAQWRERLPEDFQVNKGYITNWEEEAEQLTWECGECGVEISETVYRKNDELCDECLRQMEVEEKRSLRWLE